VLIFVDEATEQVVPLDVMSVLCGDRPDE